MSERVERIKAYFHEQYDLESGSARGHVESLFHDDFVYHIGPDATVGREELVATTEGLRATPRERRRIEVGEFQEEGDVVRFHLLVETTTEAGESRSHFDTIMAWTFGPDGRIVESRPDQGGEARDTMRAMGADI